jgi:hypothetical protein
LRKNGKLADFRRIMASPNRPAWGDDPTPPVGGQKDVAEPPNGGEGVRWTQGAADGQAELVGWLKSLSDLAVVDGTVLMPAGTPWMTLEASSKSWWVGWCFDTFCWADDHGTRGKRKQPTGNSYVPNNEIGEDMFAFPLHHGAALARFAKDEASRRADLAVPAQARVEVLDPRPFEALWNEERRLSTAIASRFRQASKWGFVLNLPADLAARWFAMRDAATTLASDAGEDELNALADDFEEFVAETARTTDPEKLDYVDYRTALTQAARWRTREHPLASERDLAEDAESLIGLSP